MLRERRVLISAAGPQANVLKIRPQLVFSTEHADMLVERLDQSLQALNQGLRIRRALPSLRQSEPAISEPVARSRQMIWPLPSGTTGGRSCARAFAAPPR